MNTQPSPVTVARLVGFVDQHHDVKRGTGCHTEPGIDCEPWCDACRVLRDVPAQILEDARHIATDQP